MNTATMLLLVGSILWVVFSILQLISSLIFGWYFYGLGGVLGLAILGLQIATSILVMVGIFVYRDALSAPISGVNAPFMAPGIGSGQVGYRICPKCGRQISADDKFCPHCGWQT